ncbi:MAG: aminotransferase class V-fold PLP-dependent enzyme [Planctomycetota bacterium]
MDVLALRRRFPALRDERGAPLDNAATTHRPEAVIEALSAFYAGPNANVHRASHRRAREATELYERARRRVARFVDAEPREVVFTRNATEAINLAARGWAEARLSPGDVVVVTALEHHSNLVPWQQVCARTGARLEVLPVDAQGRLPVPGTLPPGTRLVAATRVSNALGTLVDTDRLVALAHASGAAALLDLAQAAGHLPLDGGSRRADFLALSAHKMYGPMGLGVLVARGERGDEMAPVAFGGEMVTRVTQEAAQFQPPPLRFEAGTPPVAEAHAFTAALDLIDELGLDALRAHERGLVERLLAGLAEVSGVRRIGPERAEERSGSVAWDLPGADPLIAAAVLDEADVAVRAGFHCAEPLHHALGLGPTLRASVAAYTTYEDVERLISALPDAVSAAR